jgi:hypothetical protein
MGNLEWNKMANLRTLASAFISAALAPAIFAQASHQLQIEVGPNQQVRILAIDANYGDVLRALQKKLGWEIEIPPIADELRLSFIRIETTQPQNALVKLLEGSRLGYAFLGEASGSHRTKVIVIPLAPRDARLPQDTTSRPPALDSMRDAGDSPSLQTQVQTAITSQPNEVPPGSTPDSSPAPPTMPLADAINAMGVPPSVSPEDVGRAMTFPMSDAARIIGFPPGVLPADVGRTITMPLATGSGKRP